MFKKPFMEERFRLKSFLILFSLFYVLEGLVILLHSVLKAAGNMMVLLWITAIQLALSFLLVKFISKNQSVYMFQIGAGCAALFIMILMICAINVIRKENLLAPAETGGA